VDKKLVESSKAEVGDEAIRDAYLRKCGSPPDEEEIRIFVRTFRTLIARGYEKELKEKLIEMARLDPELLEMLNESIAKVNKEDKEKESDTETEAEQGQEQEKKVSNTRAQHEEKKGWLVRPHSSILKPPTRATRSKTG
jgi:hypothetical protein